jgi:hypothetical protein
MKFKMTPARWLFIVSTIYFVIGMGNIFIYHFTKTEIIQVVWVIILSMPLYVPPLGRWVGLKF